MICRRCLTLATSVSRQAPRAARRAFSSSALRANASPAAAAAPSDTTAASEPVFGTPLSDDAGEAKPQLSSCPKGTVLTGLNYLKSKGEPVALADEAYPEWLWRCLDVQKRADDQQEDSAGDEFSKSKKQRRLAAKRQRALEARLLAEGNVEALAPKIPLQQQTINLPGSESGSADEGLKAAAARGDLTRALRKERKAKIKETNYLKAM